MLAILRSLAVVVLLAAPATAAAQEARSGSSPEERSPISYLLTQRQKLGLTAEQEKRLEEIHMRLAEKNREIFEKVRELRSSERPARPRDMSQADREALRRRMEEVRPLREQIRTNQEAALKEALEALGSEQRNLARDLLEERRNAMRGSRPGRPTGMP